LFHLAALEWLEGGWPYSHLFDHKPPGIFFSQALTVIAFGEAQWGIRVVDIFVVILIGWLIGGLFGRDSQGARGAGALLACSMYYTCFSFWHTAQVEIWQALWLTLALRASLVERLRRREVALVGALCGLAFVYKYSAVLPAIFFWLFASWRLLAQEAVPRTALQALRSFAASGVVFGSAAAATIVLAFAPFAFAGALGDLWEATVLFNLHYASGSTFRFHELWDFVSNWSFPWSVLVVVAGGVTTWRFLKGGDNVWRHGALLGLFAVCFAGIIIQRRFYIYHFVILLPVAVGLVMGFLGSSKGWLTRRGTALVVLTSLVMLLAAPRRPDYEVTRYPIRIQQGIQYLLGGLSEAELNKSLTGFDHYHYDEVVSIAEWLKGDSSQGDTLCVFGFQPLFYVMSDLRCPSRFVSTHVLRMSDFFANKKVGAFNGGAHVNEFLEQLNEAPPTYIALRQGPPPPGYKVRARFTTWAIATQATGIRSTRSGSAKTLPLR